MNFQGVIPGEFYYYRRGVERIGIILHLAGVLPGGFLAALQFIPIIRHKFLLFHRLNGYAAIILFLAGNAGAFMLMQHAVGGSMLMIAFIGVLGTMTTGGILLAYVNIKRLQIDQHRAWMLRTWTWASSIISLRLIQRAALHVMAVYGITVHEAIRCAEIFYMYSQYDVPDAGNPTGLLYPTCTMAFGTDGQPTAQDVSPKSNTQTFVSIASNGEGPEAAAAQLRATFVMAAFVALTIHAIAVETYLWLTPAENYRLRCVSYERQVERGWRQRGQYKDSGLTGTRIGDAPQWWSVPREDLDTEYKTIAAAHLDTEHKTIDPVVETASHSRAPSDSSL